MKVCSVDSCNKNVLAKGFCDKHYAYNHRHGRPTPPTLKERILSNIKVVGGCWEYQGVLSKYGYAIISVNGKSERVHRASYREFVGEIPSGLVVMHICDNRGCCNPSHLTVGTNKENTKDKVNKERQARGEKLPHSKLTEEDVLKIRDLSCEGYTQTAIAKEFGVTQAAISYMLCGNSWSHV